MSSPTPHWDTPHHLAKLFDLEGEVALVTGAGSGLGRAIALGLGGFGAAVVAVDLNVPALAEVVSQMQQQRIQAFQFEADVTSDAAMSDVARQLDMRPGLSPTILVNAAGINIRNPALDVSLEEFQRVIAVNVGGALRCVQLFSRGMLDRRHGKIINISSVFGSIAMNGQTSYAVSKGGINQLTRVLAVEYAPHNVQVNAIAPAHFRTALSRPVLEDPQLLSHILARIPQQRIAEPWEVVGAAVLLASPASSFITGTVLPVDGGWLAM